MEGLLQGTMKFAMKFYIAVSHQQPSAEEFSGFNYRLSGRLSGNQKLRLQEDAKISELAREGSRECDVSVHLKRDALNGVECKAQ